MTFEADLMRKCQGLEADLDTTLQLLGEALRTIQAIKHEAQAELDRIERHGGAGGFAERVYKLATKGERGHA